MNRVERSGSGAVWLLLAALLVFCAPAPAAEDPAVAAAQRFLEQQSRGLGGDAHVEVYPSGARFGHCAEPRAFFPGNGQRRWGRVTVGVRCGDGAGEVRYLQARVSVSVRYWVTARAVDSDTPIDASMLEARQGDLGELPREVVRDLESIRGQVTGRPLAKGTVLQQALLRTPPLVERRQPVSVEATGSGFRIARQGRALDAGARGERVRVRMPDRQTLSGTVVGPGRVAVNW
ncbi:flagellar basal body P-ring formation chaperone FlgA [Parahaliea mediterranea]|uniref:Flagella basal body P-ring formation protein FlgA n=1 Tax=Parahaliea mediterranea TaxID=651086 RepID=A0A939DDF1_9GAMM|nr:flagellar basal body P-ring formation chaperone FlgA [Parahaliea mediterranea]MBN7795851.1 flagellar basal body P-ring formation protein FlgA [Parahaliea mediterranea]